MDSQPKSDQLRALHQRYQESLPDKAAVLDSGWLSLPAWDSQQCALLHANLHQLAGSLGMYGYDQAAELAREAMDDVASDAFEFSRGQAKLKSLIAALRQASRQPLK